MRRLLEPLKEEKSVLHRELADKARLSSQLASANRKAIAALEDELESQYPRPSGQRAASDVRSTRRTQF